MAISTIHAHVNRASEFFNKASIYFAIGKTSAWTDENVPPVEDPATSALTQIIGYKKVNTLYHVVPDPDGTIKYKDNNWRIVPANQAMAEGARWIYIETTINYDELPLGFYRQVGIYVNLVKKAGVAAGKVTLLPDEVENAGTLEAYDNRQLSNRQIDTTEKLSVVIEF